MAFHWNRDDTVGTFATSAPPADHGRRTKLAGLLVGSYDYLCSHGPDHPDLAGAVTALTAAVGAYQAQDDDATTDGIRRTLDAINDVRRRDPSLPTP